ncbi:MAG: aminoglycoside phosphotransferase family protein [Defluviitaleaceae bacterium]|nr:aminoglycoside phosphotransferase family protein [Defluviitaleaceae bacterium]
MGADFESGFAGNVKLAKTPDGRQCVYKSYSGQLETLIDEEWDTLKFLHGLGYSVPEPYDRRDNGICMQYIDGGTLWDNYQNAGAVPRWEMMKKFSDLLVKLHEINLDKVNLPRDENFVQGEIARIRQISSKFNDYDMFINKLDAASKNVVSRPLCLIHNDYHPWNVLADKQGSLYVIDFVLTAGDFRYDVAWTYALMKRTGFEAFAEDFLKEYRNYRPDIDSDFEFFIQLSNLRWLVNVMAATRENDDASPFFAEMIKQAEGLMHL